MKRVFAVFIVATMALFMSTGASWATKPGHTPVNVCHATSSDTNPYVFITVDDDSVKFKGHLMHRNAPNKTWKSDGVWNGVEHEVGDLKPDRIATYTDSQGVTHELDGTFEDCGTGPTPTPTPTTPSPSPTQTTPTPTPTETTPTPSPSASTTPPIPSPSVTPSGGNNHPPKPPAAKPPKAPAPTLPHTGANPWLALLATVLVGGGATLIKFSASS